MKIIGITGGIGSGKTAITEYLTQKGYVVIDADQVAREAVLPGSECLNTLRDYFGETVLQSDGSLNRVLLADIVFSDKDKLRFLNEILHKEIIENINEFIENQRRAGLDILFLCAPLLIETGMHEGTDEVWLVDARDEIRVGRVIQRDGVTEEDVGKRIDAQLPIAEKMKYAHVLIDNSGDVDKLYQMIDTELMRIKSK